MPLPSTIDSYQPELDIFDKALADEIGVRVCYKSREKAQNAQARFHNARALDREQNKRIYEKKDMLWGKSPYDALICRLREDESGEWWIYIERHGREIVAVEPLSEVES